MYCKTLHQAGSLTVLQKEPCHGIDLASRVLFFHFFLFTKLIQTDSGLSPGYFYGRGFTFALFTITATHRKALYYTAHRDSTRCNTVTLPPTALHCIQRFSGLTAMFFTLASPLICIHLKTVGPCMR